MQMMTALTRQAKEMLVLDLYYNQNYTYRQIAKEAKICPRDIKTILDKKTKEVELIQSTSISSQAFNLFLQGKTPVDVAIMLNLKEPEVHEFYRQYLSLQQLHDLYQIYEKVRDGIDSFVMLYKLIEAAGMDLKHVRRLLEVANGELPKVEEMYKNLLSDIMNLNQKKRHIDAAILKLNGDYIYLRNTADHQKLECEKQESESRNLYLKKIRLETVIKELQNSQEYTKIEMIVKQQVNKMFVDDKQLLRFAFEAIIESLLNNPYRLQSFMGYSMSVASTSNSLYDVSHNGNDSHPTFDTQCYLSPNYYSDCIQEEYLRNIILNESEKFYNQKIEELKNQTICEAAVSENNNEITDEKQSIKELPLLGFGESS
jgi:predicted transcriptional regulator